MASSSGKRTSSSNRTRKSTTNSRSRQAQRTAQDSELFHEIGLIVLFVVMVILFCCNFGIIGPVGNAYSGRVPLIGEPESHSQKYHNR